MRCDAHWEILNDTFSNINFQHGQNKHKRSILIDMCRLNNEQINSIWKKASVVEGFDPDAVRKDVCGAWILRSAYADRSNPYGWEIDHICPQKYLREKNVPEDVIDDIANLRPLHWRNNVSKDTDYPMYHACSTSENNYNIYDKDIICEVSADKQAELRALYSNYV